MSKDGRARGGRGCGDKSAVPYSTITRRERSRKLAQKRRDTYKKIMDDMTDVMPFQKDVVSQLDYNSRLRLTICFFHMKAMLKAEREEELEEMVGGVEGGGAELAMVAGGEEMALSKTKKKPRLFQTGMIQDLMCEALDGFLMVTQVDGTIVFLSESIHKHLGLFQSEHIGINVYDLILEEDHEDVRRRLTEADEQSVKRKTKDGATEVSFFCRMKCSRFKLANTATKSPGYKLVYVSGALKVAGDQPFIACVVRPVSPPSVLEIRMEGNMFVAHYSMEFSCIYFDGRLRHLLGYSKEDFLGKSPFNYQHHDDIEATMRCSKEVQTKGEGLSGYYRFLNRFGEYIWIQSRAVLVMDSCSGRPSHIVCTNFVISKEDGNKDLLLRQAVASGQSEFIEKTMTHENPLALRKRADSNKTVAPLHSKSDEVLPSAGGSLAARLKLKEESSALVRHLTTSSEGQVITAPSTVDSTRSAPSAENKASKSSSLLYSMLSGGTISPPQPNERTIHSATPSVSSVHTEEANSPANSTISSSSQRASAYQSSHQNRLDSEDSYLHDSSSISNQSSPYNPSSVPQDEKMANGKTTALTMSYGDRTMSGSDLGYHSESNNSIRERMTPSFTGYESETSSYMYESGTDTSPPDPYSPDYPFSVVSSDGSITSHVSFMTSPPSESHSPSQFQNPGSIHSVIDEAVGSPTYFVPIDERDFGAGYMQRSPSNLSTDSEYSVGSQRSKVGLYPPQQWSPGSSVSSPPQAMIKGENPVNNSYGQRGLAFAKMEPMQSPRTGLPGAGINIPPQGFQGGNILMNGNLGDMRYRYSGGRSPNQVVLPPQARNLQPTSTPSVVQGDFFIASVSGVPSSTQASLQGTRGKMANSDLPQLSVEDLKMLDCFDPKKEEDQFGQLLYHQTALSCRGTMMM